MHLKPMKLLSCEAGREFATFAALVQPGEWTTYGDVAAAAGASRSPRAVGREAAVSEDFPNAHRVLRHEGTIARGRTSEAARARRLLEGEGIAFSPSGSVPHSIP